MTIKECKDSDMNKWKKVKISDSFILQMGKTPSRNEPSFWNNPLYNWVSISDMNQKYICLTKEKISPIALEKTGIKKVPKGTIMLSFKLSLGKVSISALDLYTNEAIMSFFPKNKNEWNIDFLYNYFKWLDWGKKAQKAVKGSTLNKNSLGNIEIPLPPMEEQKKIAARLDAVSELLEKQKQLLAEQDTLIKSVFYDLFGNPNANLYHFPTVLAKELFEVRSSKRIYQQDIKETGIPFLRVSDLNNLINEKNAKIALHISEEKYKSLSDENAIPKKGDILLTSRGTIGESYIVKANDKFYFQDGMISWLKQIGKQVLPIFFKHLISSLEYKRKIMDLTKGAVVTYLSLEKIEKMPILLPPLELQQKFAAIVEQIESEKSKIKSAIAETQTLFNALMAEYFEE